MNLKTKALLGAGVAVGGLTGMRALRDATETRVNQIHLNANRRNDLSTPMYNPTVVKRAYDDFVQMKLASDQKREGNGVLSAMQGAATKTVGDATSRALSNVFLRPIDWATKKIEKSFVTEPKQQEALQVAMKDPSVSQFRQENPEGFNLMHKTLTQFAPQVSTNPLIVRTFLTHGASTGGNMDLATLNLILNAERSHTGKGPNKQDQ